MERSARSCTSCASSMASRCLRRWLPIYDRSVLCRFYSVSRLPYVASYVASLLLMGTAALYVASLLLMGTAALYRLCSYVASYVASLPLSHLTHLCLSASVDLHLSCYIFASLPLPLCLCLATSSTCWALSLARSVESDAASECGNGRLCRRRIFWRKKISYAPSAQILVGARHANGL